MSSLRLCDSEECCQTENNCKIYDIDYDTKEFLKEHCKSWFNYSCDDVCSDCVDNINLDYDGFFIIDRYGDLSIGQKYLDNPSLLR